MRIDLGAIVPEAPDPGRSAKSGARVAPGASSSELAAGGVDTAHLSQAQSRVQQLVSQAIQLPEIRIDRVASLQRAIGDGSYQVAPEQTAEALIFAIQVPTAA